MPRPAAPRRRRGRHPRPVGFTTTGYPRRAAMRTAWSASPASSWRGTGMPAARSSMAAARLSFAAASPIAEVAPVIVLSMRRDRAPHPNWNRLPYRWRHGMPKARAAARSIGVFMSSGAWRRMRSTTRGSVAIASSTGTALDHPVHQVSGPVQRVQRFLLRHVRGQRQFHRRALPSPIEERPAGPAPQARPATGSPGWHARCGRARHAPGTKGAPPCCPRPATPWRPSSAKACNASALTTAFTETSTTTAGCRSPGR